MMKSRALESITTTLGNPKLLKREKHTHGSHSTNPFSLSPTTPFFSYTPAFIHPNRLSFSIVYTFLSIYRLSYTLLQAIILPLAMSAKSLLHASRERVREEQHPKWVRIISLSKENKRDEQWLYTFLLFWHSMSVNRVLWIRPYLHHLQNERKNLRNQSKKEIKKRIK